MPTRVTIDRRPMSLVLLSRSYRLAFLGLLGFLFYLFIQSSPWEGITPEAYKAIGAFLLCAILWLTQVIPLAITGLLAIVIIPVLGILPSKEVFGYFGNEAIFFILGAFILAAAIMATGLSTRLAILFLGKGRLSPKKLAFRIMLSTALLSCVMSEHAVAAFFFPIVLEITRALEYEPFGGEYGKTLFLALAWGCIIGGIVTFLGGARAPLALGMLYEITGTGINFFDWIKTSIFVAIPLFIVAYFILTRFFVTDVTDVSKVKFVLEKKRKSIGKLGYKELMVALILITSIFFWMIVGGTGSMASIAIIAVVALFVFNLVSWRDMEEYVNWGVILMYGGAIALGRAVDSSGALVWIADQVFFFPEALSGLFGGSHAFWLIASLSFISIILTALFSNAAVVALLLPISISMALSFKMEASLVTYAVALASGLGFMMPMGTPAVAIAYSSGYLKIRDIVIPGFILSLFGWIFFVLVTKFWWPVIGYSL